MNAPVLRVIYCTGCQVNVDARLTNGAEVYPHRDDLARQPFWKCPGCGLHVGCHHRNTSNPYMPLGVIPTAALRRARGHIHALLDPMWQGGPYSRTQVYKAISARIGFAYHTAELRTVEEAREAYRIIRDIARNGLDATQDQQHDDDQKDQPKPTGRVITPARGIGPGRQGAEQQQDQNNDQNRGHL